MNRRHFLQTSSAFAATALTGCKRITAPAQPSAPALPWYDAASPILPIHADIDRIFRITVCLRPFRAAGPRMDVERVNDKTIVHNYGHGGSGWSLSWGAADVAITSAITALDGHPDIAILGCGALGLTAALTAQRAGLKVTIYARERPPFVRSSRATGSWTPDSRIALTGSVAPTFPAQWESMARASFAMYQSYLGAPGTPIEWTDRYYLSDGDTPEHPTPPHDFIHLNPRIADLTPHFRDMPPGSTPFPTKIVRSKPSLTFNVADYSRQLLNDFLIAGGTIETREFHTPADLAALPQRVLINCTGYGARQLFADESVVPVRGQIAWLIPQPGVDYGIVYGNLNVLARRDGIVIQPSPQGDETGWNDTNEQPDRAEAEAGVRDLQALYARMTPKPSHS
jgi:glycine/D-amino acid oxidase-like deaminating enzyme